MINQERMFDDPIIKEIREKESLLCATETRIEMHRRAIKLWKDECPEKNSNLIKASQSNISYEEDAKRRILEEVNRLEEKRK